MSTDLVTMDKVRARRITDQIKVAVEATWELVAEAYSSRAWEALGYTSWDDYTTREFGTARLRLPREERQEVISSLRDQGLSLRAIAAVTGDSKDTVARAIAPVSNATPEPLSEQETVDLAALEAVVDKGLAEIEQMPEDIAQEVAARLAAADPEYAQKAKTAVTGLDGKTYRPSPKPKSRGRKKPITEAAKKAGFELRSAMDRVGKLFDDPRYRENEDQVATALRGHLVHVAETVAAVLDQLP